MIGYDDDDDSYMLNGVHGIHIQYNIVKTLIAQIRTVAVIVLSFGLQDIAREFYTGQKSENISTDNFVLTCFMAILVILALTIIEAYLDSWQENDILKYQAHKEKAAHIGTSRRRKP